MVRVASFTSWQRVECWARGIMQAGICQHAGPLCTDVKWGPDGGCVSMPEAAGQTVRTRSRRLSLVHP